MRENKPVADLTPDSTVASAFADYRQAVMEPVEIKRMEAVRKESEGAFIAGAFAALKIAIVTLETQGVEAVAGKMHALADEILTNYGRKS